MNGRWSETKSEGRWKRRWGLGGGGAGGGGGWRKDGERLWRKKEAGKERKNEGQFAEARRLITSQLRTPDVHN